MALIMHEHTRLKNSKQHSLHKMMVKYEDAFFSMRYLRVLSLASRHKQKVINISLWFTECISYLIHYTKHKLYDQNKVNKALPKIFSNSIIVNTKIC